MLDSKADKGRMIIPGRYSLHGFSNTFCFECSNFYVTNEEKAKKCLSCLSEQEDYYKRKDTIESIEVTQDENGRNVIKAVKLM